ncbi:hypothetical protein OsJ_30470 [Oryza sativa Japonica Group]|uniref:Uncharacterized protein n=2 Tax=Oryza sativa subsp. japonica TaxID=39947 RepID=A0A8J8YEQ5_ORYSJ|nr:hypothetical protein LOC_Os10g01620 [Oryza sativa Japonica Group]EAZ15060.1 hypothetical protein OsJ_30470 [Oryza sativa Japonica Group]
MWFHMGLQGSYQESHNIPKTCIWERPKGRHCHGIAMDTFANHCGNRFFRAGATDPFRREDNV